MTIVGLGTGVESAPGPPVTLLCEVGVVISLAASVSETSLRVSSPTIPLTVPDASVVSITGAIGAFTPEGLVTSILPSVFEVPFSLKVVFVSAEIFWPSIEASVEASITDASVGFGNFTFMDMGLSRGAFGSDIAVLSRLDIVPKTDFVFSAGRAFMTVSTILL